MKSEQKNLVLAIVLSAIILGVFEIAFKPTIVAQQRAYVETSKQEYVAHQQEIEKNSRPVVERAASMNAVKRVAFHNGRISGSINLQGGRIDDVTLTNYRETVDPTSPNIVLLSPENTKTGYYSEFGWVKTGDANPVLPNGDTIWRADKTELTAAQPVTLTYDNGQGLEFQKTYTLDQDYMITVTQTVRNKGNTPVSLVPYALIARYYEHHGRDFFVLHEGLLGVLDGTLQETRYKDIRETQKQEFTSTGGWLGITDKYWLAALSPMADQPIKARFAYSKVKNDDRYQTDYTLPEQKIAPGQSATAVNRFFAGAKEVKLLDRYEKESNIPRFDLAVDFGWYYFLTKPFFLLLHFLYTLLGNFGIAILVLTVIVKGVMFPLANKSYHTMNKMKELQPELIKLREEYGQDPLRLQKEMAAFYQKNQINPLAGCLPIFIQIPVFFSLYKVLFVSIEMRHQPFFGWIHDLSAPDPTTIFNLFGLIDWAPPAYFLFIPLHVGAWPIIMGFTMWLQQRLNPAPMDSAQRVVFGLFPYLFTFMLSSFPAGLVIYWSWSNLLGILQQYAIKRHKIGPDAHKPV
ncbi:MAG: membrane protein insertase YidC [Alphaproteobacteria bacterium]|nr:MAG: membrane protein insertase YidC [Alphaproteobacteria bacterium]